LIDFRYHLVSLTAGFLALAVGITMGARYLPSPSP
jgi:Copper transport outer membrane protein, MctB